MKLIVLLFSFIGVYHGQSCKKEYVRKAIDDACYEKCISFLREDHQIIVFVHSRNSTNMLSKTFIEKAANAVSNY